jgi:hypothetical protein
MRGDALIRNERCSRHARNAVVSQSRRNPAEVAGAKANLDQHLLTSSITPQERTAEGRLTGTPPTIAARFSETKIG